MSNYVWAAQQIWFKILRVILLESPFRGQFIYIYSSKWQFQMTQLCCAKKLVHNAWDDGMTITTRHDIKPRAAKMPERLPNTDNPTDPTVLVIRNSTFPLYFWLKLPDIIWYPAPGKVKCHAHMSMNVAVLISPWHMEHLRNAIHRLCASVQPNFRWIPCCRCDGSDSDRIIKKVWKIKPPVMLILHFFLK